MDVYGVKMDLANQRVQVQLLPLATYIANKTDLLAILVTTLMVAHGVIQVVFALIQTLLLAQSHTLVLIVLKTHSAILAKIVQVVFGVTTLFLVNQKEATALLPTHVKVFAIL